MYIFLGYIEKKVQKNGDFYNFNPLFIVKGTQLIPLTSDDYKQYLPESEKRNINLSYRFDNPKYSQIIKFLEHYTEHKLPVILNLKDADLIDNWTGKQERNKTGYKINVCEAIDSGGLTSPSNLGFYRLLSQSDLRANFIKNKIVPISEKIPVFPTEKVLIDFDEDRYAGPYQVDYRPTDNCYYLRSKIVDNKYVMVGYQTRDCLKTTQRPSINFAIVEWTFIVPKDTSSISYSDVIDEAELLESFKQAIGTSKIQDGKISVNEFGVLAEIYEKSLIVASDIPEKIKEERSVRLRGILTSTELLAENLRYISREFSTLLTAHKNTSEVNTMLEQIVEDDPDFYERLRETRAIQDAIAQLQHIHSNIESKTKDAERNLRELEERADTFEETVIQRQMEERNKMDADHQETKKALSIAREELAQLTYKIGVAKDLSDLQAKEDDLRRSVDRQEWREGELSKSIEDSERAFDELLVRRKSKIVDIAFDGFVSNKILTAAAQWEQENDFMNYQSAVSEIGQLAPLDKSGEDLIAHLCQLIQTERPTYCRNTILNLLICTCQGFLTVLSGEPGCGKTSICTILSKALGLSKIDQLVKKTKSTSIHCDRFVPISVERGWTSKRDLIGYFNPLSKTFDKSNTKMYDLLRILHMEYQSKNNPFPAFVLLDEANLSPVEYYWADFMNICDELDENSCINLGGGEVLNIPDTLHFLATINNDHTTEILSPRVIDRAWIIKLPEEKEFCIGGSMPLDLIQPISWNDMGKLFCGARQPMPEEIKAIYRAVLQKARSANSPVSPRTNQAIMRYWSVAQELFEAEGSNSSSIIALDYAVAQRILPKLSGHGESFLKEIEKFRDECYEDGLHLSANFLIDMIQRGKDNMGYYQFF